MKWYNHLPIDIEIVCYFISEVNKWFWIVQIIELVLIFLTHEVNFEFDSESSLFVTWHS